MKKIKIIIVNILLVIFLLFFWEVILIFFDVYKDVKIQLSNSVENQYKLSIKEIKNLFVKNTLYLKIDDFFELSEFRGRVGEQYQKNDYSILLAGCSFTYGNNLLLEDSFGFILSENIKRMVNNIGLPGGSPREFLYILKNEKYRNYLIGNDKNIKYVIYTYITDQKDRLYYSKYRLKTPVYKLQKDSTLIEDKSFIWFKQTNIYKYFHMIYQRFLSPEIKFDNFCLFIEEINKEIKKYLISADGNPPKLVVFVYQDFDNDDWKKLKNDDIMIVKLNEISSIDFNSLEYYGDDKVHPNSKAWKEIVPLLVKELKL